MISLCELYRDDGAHCGRRFKGDTDCPARTSSAEECLAKYEKSYETCTT